LAPNHASYLDPPILGISVRRRVTYLAKEYLFQHGFVGWVLRKVGAYPIKSETGTDFRSIRDLIRILKRGACVVVFPEGTRSPDGNLQAPESGIGFLAVKSGAWVVPAYIRGSFDAMPRGTKGVRLKPVSVHYGEPFVATEERFGSGDEAYMAVSRHIMAEIEKIKAGTV
jgi:1-acyl-sn-glycerol-3-phosphate acyltransferase